MPEQRKTITITIPYYLGGGGISNYEEPDVADPEKPPVEGGQTPSEKSAPVTPSEESKEESEPVTLSQECAGAVPGDPEQTNPEQEEVQNAEPSLPAEKEETVETANAPKEEPEAVTKETDPEPVKEQETQEEVKEEETSEEVKDGETEEETEEEEQEDAPVAFSQSANVNGVTVAVSADVGVFPADAVLFVRDASHTEKVRVQRAVKAQRGDKNLAACYTFDIKVIDSNGTELQPDTAKGRVYVSFNMAEVKSRNLEADVYHISDSMTAEKLDTVTTAKSVICAETTGFSLYTVEFTYEGLQYVMPGDSEIELSVILAEIGLTGTVSAASCSNPSLFSVEQRDGVWYVVAHQAFTSEEALLVTLDGEAYEIKVTDDQVAITEREVTIAPLVDHGPPEGPDNNIPVGPSDYSVTKIGTGGEGTRDNPYKYKFSGTDFLAHYNGNHTLAYWFGIGIQKPETGIGVVYYARWTQYDGTSDIEDHKVSEYGDYDTMYVGKLKTIANSTVYVVARYTKDYFEPKDVYYEFTFDESATLKKEDPGVTPPTAVESLKYNGSEQTLVRGGIATHGAMDFFVTTDSAPLPADAVFTSTPTAINAGDYYVWYRVTGYTGYNDVGAMKLSAPITIAKADQTKPTAPTESSKTANSITLTQVDGCQYKRGDDGDWQDSNTFTGLESGKEYSFYQRKKETENYNASQQSEAASISTLQGEPFIELTDVTIVKQDGTPLTTNPRVGDTLKAIPNDGATGPLNWWWHRVAWSGGAGSEISSARSDTYTLTEDDVYHSISVWVEQETEDVIYFDYDTVYMVLPKDVTGTGLIEGKDVFDRNGLSVTEHIVQDVQFFNNAQKELNRFAASYRESDKDIIIQREVTLKRASEINGKEIDIIKREVEKTYVGFKDGEISYNYLDISIFKYVRNVVTGKYVRQPDPITTSDDTVFTVKVGINESIIKRNPIVVRIHEGTAKILPKNKGNNGYYAVGINFMDIYSNLFSTYAIVYPTVQTAEISFDSNKGTYVEPIIVTKTAKVGEDYDFELPVPKRDGYKFTGWYVNQNLASNTKVLDGQTLSTGVLYAGWERINSASTQDDETDNYSTTTNGGNTLSRGGGSGLSAQAIQTGYSSGASGAATDVRGGKTGDTSATENSLRLARMSMAMLVMLFCMHSLRAERKAPVRRRKHRRRHT